MSFVVVEHGDTCWSGGVGVGLWGDDDEMLRKIDSTVALTWFTVYFLQNGHLVHSLDCLKFGSSFNPLILVGVTPA